MRASARLRNEVWCMDRACVDKLAKENNSVKYLLVHRDLFDRKVKANGMKTKGSRKIVKTFSSMIDPCKRIDRKRFGLTSGPNLLERFKIFVLQRGYKFTLLWMRLRRLLMNVQNDHWKTFFTVTWKIMHTSIHTNYFILSLPKTLEETVR